MSGLDEAVNTLKNKTLQNVTIINEKLLVSRYPADGAIDPNAQGSAVLTKGSAGAYTLRAPTAAEEGLVVTVISDSAFAHVVTATGLLNDGVTGGAKNAATFAAFKGAAMVLQAVGLFWAVVSLKAVTVA